ncbi:hypothetical protein CCP3SC1_660023 [Gammaproteobacteria bacterium]
MQREIYEEIWGHKDKRAYPRYKCNIGVRIIIENDEFYGIATDISVGGMRLVSDQLPFDAPNITHTITLGFRIGISNTEILARICWSTGNIFGVQFMCLLQEEELVSNFLEHPSELVI